MKANQFIPPAAAERAYTNFAVDENGCHVSGYSIISNTRGGVPYAQVGWGATPTFRRGATTAHRAAWVHVHGQIPDGMTIDHVCKNTLCVNVEHLRMLSNFENGRRTFGRDWPLGQCINGHPNSELVQEPSGKWKCRPCSLEWSRRYAANNPEKVRESRARYLAQNPEKRRETNRRSNAKRRAF